NGCGIITIAQKDIETFYEKLIKFYETGKDNDLKKFIYNNCIDGLDL
ncbi:MAG TPA: cell filamentation protein Fic, partial [Mollicutes bacterium]|nr:cell filamentation protein Fic [Mollicutes bacterium]